MTSEAPPPTPPAGMASASTEEGPPGSTHAFHVLADPELRDLIPGYLENKRKDAAKMRENLEREDFEALRIQGHSLAGSGGAYGFPGLTRIGRLMERAGAARDGEAARQALAELDSYLRRVVVDYG